MTLLCSGSKRGATFCANGRSDERDLRETGRAKGVGIGRIDQTKAERATWGKDKIDDALSEYL
jgi:hypothetical protein